MLKALWLAGLATASITIQVHRVDPLPFSTSGIATSAADLFSRSCPEEAENTASLLASSFDDLSGRNVFPSSDGFVRGAVEAWAKHEHLILRPDEIWFEVLAQMNVYMSTHSESLRHLFVDHSGREKITVEGFSWDGIIGAFRGEIQKRVKTGWLLDWITPGFSTSTAQDDVTATVLMMGLMQHFFEFEGMVVCGIPSVTLLGEKEDWVKLGEKVEMLKEFGNEAAGFAERLRPIMKRFVSSWDVDTDGSEGDGERRLFWEQIVRAKKQWSCGEGASEWDVSGWITGFMHWDRDGKVRGVYEDWYDNWDDEEEEEAGEKVEEVKKEEVKIEEEVQIGIFPNDWTVTIDGQSYIPCTLSDISIGYAKAPLTMKNYPSPGVDTQAYLVAGNVGVEKKNTPGGVMAQPVSGWFVYAGVDGNYSAGPWIGSREELEGIAGGIVSCKATLEASSKDREVKEEEKKEGEEEVKDL
ncbi:hypothetical protein DER46DRAFT_118895 [Fusarium sp. MPI-SDFR-AT-0072]|uniref:Uncharacterized protein n=1 Tax=Fusarium oxysporum f. sp. rapae TaxID=485398 RepID=A0A8J5U053_FUSOX|nr:hypothetical protein Forpe1208_v005264 [Fusarium oxysporum f. sp. rapae]KAH7177294.1 hypothetical protein DER46DRAFT_118895 [Fusarium sp. MPI-SDFR-AT-0072]